MTEASRLRHYIDVVTVLTQKDFKVRYRNSVLGFLWSLLNPLAYMVILTAVFGLLFRVNIPNYAAWLLTALLVWRFFSIGTSQGLFSILSNGSLVTKTLMPRYVIVLSNSVANLIGASLEFVALFPLLVLLGIRLTTFAFLLPGILILEFLLVFAVSLSLSSLTVKYRDFYQLWDIALQLGFFLSPIVYNEDLIPARFRFVYSLNPVTRLIESARGIFFLAPTPSRFDLGVIAAIIGFFLLLGFVVFRALEWRFAEEF